MPTVPWPLMRGHIYRFPMRADDPAKAGAPISKYAVILQGQKDFRNKPRVSVVLATTTLKGIEHPWKVFVPARTLRCWPADTLICCEDVYSYLRTQIQAEWLEPVGVVPHELMAKVDLALAVSLGLT